MTTALGTLLRSARKAKGLTQMQVAAQVGVTYSAVGQYETGSIKNPRPEKIAAIAKVLEIDADALSERLIESYGLALSPESTPPAVASRLSPSPREVELVLDPPTLRQMFGEHDVKELGRAVGGEDGDFTLNGEAIAMHARPLTLRGRKVFAIRVKGTSMEPRHEEGDLLYVEWNREPRPGEDGVFEMYSEDPDGETRGFIKRLNAKGMGVVVVEQFNPKKQFTYQRDQVKAIHRVVPWREVAGVL